MTRKPNPTQDNSRLVLNLALNYGGRVEIVDAIKSILIAHQQGTLEASHLDEKTLPGIYTAPTALMSIC